MRRLLFLLCLLIGFAACSQAAPLNKQVKVKVLSRVIPHHAPYHIQYDSTKLNVHSFNAKVLDKYRNSPEFTYTEKAKRQLSWWTRFWNWVWEMIAKLFGGSDQKTQAPSIPYLKWIIGAIALALLVFVIVKMAGLNIKNIFNRESRDINLPYSESLENINLITFEEEIERAINQRNYRLAIRLLYLSTLKQLNDLQLIHWQIEKTNSAYLDELSDAGQKQSFGILTRQFEYVWYGDFPVDGASYSNISTLFHDFKTMLK